MRASIPFEFTDHDRTLIARFLGNHGMASHVQCVGWACNQMRVSLSVMAQGKPLPPPDLDLQTRGTQS